MLRPWPFRLKILLSEPLFILFMITHRRKHKCEIYTNYFKHHILSAHMIIPTHIFIIAVIISYNSTFRYSQIYTMINIKSRYIFPTTTYSYNLSTASHIRQRYTYPIRVMSISPISSTYPSTIMLSLFPR